jgi:hypothetical protein
MKRILLSLFVVTILFQSCKKEDKGSQQPEPSVLDYMPLSIGNYWIYQTSECDSGAVNCQPWSTDTNMITKDTMIGNNKYFKIEGKHMYWKNPRFYRDSGDYIVDERGKIIFTIENGQQTFNHTSVVDNGDTLYYWYYKLEEKPESVTVKAGTFQCLNFKGMVYRKQDNFLIHHDVNHLFSKDVGLVSETALFTSNLKVTKRDLIGYFIQPKSDIVP